MAATAEVKCEVLDTDWIQVDLSANHQTQLGLFASNEVPLTLENNTENGSPNLSDVKTQASDAMEEARQHNIELARRGFLFRLFALPIAFACLGISVTATVFSGGVTAPITVIISTLSLTLLADTICCGIDYYRQKHGEEPLPLGADSLGNLIYLGLRKLDCTPETSFKAAKKVSLGYRVFFSLGCLVNGAPSLTVNFDHHSPTKNQPPQAYTENEAVLNTAKANYAEIKTLRDQIHQKLISSPEKPQFKQQVPLAPSGSPLFRTQKKAIIDSKVDVEKNLKQAYIKLARRQFFIKLVTTGLLVGGLTFLGSAIVGGAVILLPFMVLGIGVLILSACDLTQSAMHWWMLEHDDEGLPHQGQSIANLVELSLFNLGVKKATARKWASGVADTVNIFFPPCSIWSSNDEARLCRELSEQVEAHEKLLREFDNLSQSIDETERDFHVYMEEMEGTMTADEQAQCLNLLHELEVIDL